jgi:hypothetical protein
MADYDIDVGSKEDLNDNYRLTTRKRTKKSLDLFSSSAFRRVAFMEYSRSRIK